MLILILVGLGAGAFFGTGPLTRSLWEDFVLQQLRDQPSFQPQESPMRDVSAESVPLSQDRPGSVPGAAAEFALGGSSPAGPFPAGSDDDGADRVAGDAAIESGRTLYEIKCSHCHGDGGKGDGAVGKRFVAKVGDLTAREVRNQRDHELYETIARGKRIMRGFARELDDAEIRSLVQYLRTLP